MYALQADLLAPGFTQEMVNIRCINYEQWVDLTVIHHPLQTWR